MRWLPASSLLLLLLVAAPAHGGWFNDITQQIAGLFETYEEAPYTVVPPDTVGYQRREYPSRKWVCKSESNPRVGDDLSIMFWPLFNYISGTNDQNKTIPMTIPVTTEVSFGERGDKSYEMCFYLGEANQQDPPRPRPDTGVVVKEREQMMILTRTVGGYMSGEAEWMSEAGELAAVLEEDGISVQLSHMFWVGYDSPMKFWGRRNEVWFPASTSQQQQ